MQCPHLSEQVFCYETLCEKLNEMDLNQANCQGCQSLTDSRWLCLTCGQVNCGRFVKAHAKEHYKSTQHPVALDLETKACHW